MTGKRLAAALGLWAAGSAGVGLAAAALLRPSEPAAVTPAVVALVYLTLIAVLWAMARDGLAVRRASPTWVLLALAGCAVAYAATVWIAWPATFELLKAIGSDDGRLGTSKATVVGLVVLRACVLAPVGEELLFRGALYGWLRGRWSAPVAIGVSAASFALIHGFPPLLPVAFAIGIAFGLVRERCGSTVPVIVAHVVHNVGLVGFAWLTAGGTARLPAWGT